jgi:YgiT-type zinc finger domain-containing protein
MNCNICKNGETSLGTTTVALERGTTIIVFKGVPAQICNNCGEAYVDQEVGSNLMKEAEIAVQNGVELEVRSYAA